MPIEKWSAEGHRPTSNEVVDDPPQRTVKLTATEQQATAIVAGIAVVTTVPVVTATGIACHHDRSGRGDGSGCLRSSRTFGRGSASGRGSPRAGHYDLRLRYVHRGAIAIENASWLFIHDLSDWVGRHRSATGHSL